MKANSTSLGGLNKIYMLKIINVIDGFTKADNYIIDLKKSFTDVVRIELVSTEIPFIEFNIKILKKSQLIIFNFDHYLNEVDFEIKDFKIKIDYN